MKYDWLIPVPLMPPARENSSRIHSQSSPQTTPVYYADTPHFLNMAPVLALRNIS